MAERGPSRPTMTRRHSSKRKLSPASVYRAPAAAFNFEELEQQEEQYRQTRQLFRVPRPGPRPSVSRKSSYNSKVVFDWAQPKTAHRAHLDQQSPGPGDDIGSIKDRIQILNSSDDEWQSASDASPSERPTDAPSYSPEDQCLSAECARVETAFVDCLEACAGRQGDDVNMGTVVATMQDYSFRFRTWKQEVELKVLDESENSSEGRQHSLENRALRNIHRNLRSFQGLVKAVKSPLEPTKTTPERKLQAQAELSESDEDTW